LEVRRILAGEAVALAAERHTDEDIAKMQQLALEQQERLADPLAYARGDLAFQRVLIRAARNVGMELMLNSFARFPEEQPDLVATLYDKREDSLAYYGAVIDLVRAGDGAAARDTVRGVLQAIDDEWLLRHGYRTGLPGARADAADKRAKTTKPDSTKKAKPKGR
jgi:GntR family transcriptional repressor for pyruvate dehydrogenase complex